MSWHVRVIPNRYADSVRLMGVARDAARPRRRGSLRGRDGHAGQPRARWRRSAPSADARPGDVVLAVDGRGRRGATRCSPRPSGCWPRAAPPRRRRRGPAPAAHAGRRGRRTANVALVSVPGEYATLEAHQRAHARPARLPLLRPRRRWPTRWRSSGRGAAARPAGHGARVRHGDAGRHRARLRQRRAPPGRSASSPRPAPARRRPPACSMPPASACRTSSASAAATSRPPSAGTMFRQGMRCSPRDDAHRDAAARLQAARARGRRGSAGAVPAGKRVVAAFVGWDGDAAPFEVHRDAGGAAPARPPAPRRPPTRSSGPSTSGADAPGAGPRPVLRRLAGRTRRRRARAAASGRSPPSPTAVGGRRARRARPGRRALHPGPPAPDGRPRPCACELLEARRRRRTHGCVLLDVVLGHGAHPDPAGELAPRRGRVADRAPVVARVCGTDADPQDARRARPRRCAPRARSWRRPTPPPRGWRRAVRDARMSRSWRCSPTRCARAAASCTRSRSRGRWPRAATRSSSSRSARPGAGFFRAPPVPAHRRPRTRAPTRRSTTASAALIDAYADGPARAAARRPLRHRPRPGLHLGQRRADPARRGPRRARRAHRPPRRRLPLAVARRLPGALDRRPRPRGRASRTPWVARLRDEFGVEAGLRAQRRRRSSASARRATPASAPPRATPAGLDGELAILTIGGIEPRKGSLTLLEGFAAAREALPERRPVLLVAGGATLFDHRDEIDRFPPLREELGLDGRVRVLGPVADARARAPLPRRRRLRPPLGEGGLRARGARGARRRRCRWSPPTSTSCGRYLADGESALLAPAGDAAALGRALVRAAREPRRSPRGCAPAGARWRPRHGWDAAAAAHEAAYARFLAAARPLMALEVVATWRGGWRDRRAARAATTIRVDEPATRRRRRTPA